MSLLWTQAVKTSVPHMALPWRVERGEENYAHSAKPTREAGFAGYVGKDHDEDEDDYGEDEGQSHQSGGFDEDLYDESAPTPTTHQQRHYDIHGEHSDSYHDDHHEAYEKALDQRKQKAADEDRPNWTNNPLHRFIGRHGTDTDHWKQHATYGAVSLHEPVYATQSHVSQAHIDKYKQSPGASSHHVDKYGPGHNDYLGDGAPMFVTHDGDKHTIEGHHRVAAALQRGDKHIMGWHYDADKHGGFPDQDGNMPDHEDYWDEDE